jgi:16S rRNA (cytosine967-C5)-methyltransferase
VSSPRAVAADIIGRVLAGQSLNRLLPNALDAATIAQRPLCQELVYGTLREWPCLEATCLSFLAKPLRRKDQDIMALLCIGLYELEHLSTPAHAVVSETVNATRALKKPWAKGVVNGVLRTYQRQDNVAAEVLSPAAQRALPAWLHAELCVQYDGAAEQIALAARHRPPMTLRVNQLKSTRDDYLRQLTEAEIEATPCAVSLDGVVLSRPVDVGSLPGFTEGVASVQDSAAQLVARLLAPQAGERILDACAAPGGKACHLLELQPAIEELVALDISEPRLQRVIENTTRLDLRLTPLVADASELPEALTAKPFDAILADVPCSATGVIRRNPDIKILREPDDIAGFARQQLAILAGLWPALKPGGRLLYVTCSLLAAENDEVVSQFAAQYGALIESVTLCTGTPRQHGWQTLPDQHGCDGLYFALLRKPAE